MQWLNPFISGYTEKAPVTLITRELEVYTMPVRIFDFDLTITKQHTFQRPSHYKPSNNIKSGIQHIFLHTGHHIAAVATFHDKPNYVKAYIEHILGKTLTLQKSTDFEHDKLSVYHVSGEEIPLLISTIHSARFIFHRGELEKTGKNTQINRILSSLAQDQCIDIRKTEVHFYDDDKKNITHSQTLDDVGRLRTFLVSAKSVNSFSLWQGTAKDGNYVKELQRAIDALHLSIASMLRYGEHLITIGETEKGAEVKALAAVLNSDIDHFFNAFDPGMADSGELFSHFIASFKATSHSKDELMNAHRESWKAIIANICIAVTMIGLLFQGVKALTGLVQNHDTQKPGWINSCFFFGKTASQDHIEAIDASLEQITHIR